MTAELVRVGTRALVRGVFWWGIGILALTLVNVAFWPSLEGSEALEAFETMSPELLAAFGAQDIGTPAGYLDGQVYALFFPLLFSAMAIAMVTAITSGDEDAGRLELLLALPVSRQRLWLARFGASMIALAAVTVATGAVVVLSLWPFSLEEAGVAPVIVATAACGALAAFHAAIAFCAGGIGASRGQAVGVSVMVLVAGYVVAFLFPLVDALEPFGRISPWYWTIGTQPVTNGVDVPLLLLTVALAAGLVAVGAFAVTRRDVRSA